MIEDKAGDMPPDQSSMFTRVLSTQPTKHGSWEAGNTLQKGFARPRWKSRSPAPYLLNISNSF